MNIEYSVALCTHNNGDRLKKTLDDLTNLQSPQASWELVIVDNGCTDHTDEILAAFNWPENWHVRITKEEKLGLSNARNRAIDESCGNYVIFMDDDETVDTDWLRAYERLIINKKPDAFGGRICVAFEDKRPTWLTDEILGFLGELNRSDTISVLESPGSSFYGGNFGVRKSVCETIGKFDSMLGRKGNNNTGGEEIDFYHRLLAAGMKVWWTPEAIINHRIQATKLKRSYFLDLHFNQGRMEAIRERGRQSRLPPKYFYGQLLRAIASFWHIYREIGYDATLRKEMNIAYFVGKILGWALGPDYNRDGAQKETSV